MRAVYYNINFMPLTPRKSRKPISLVTINIIYSIVFIVFLLSLKKYVVKVGYVKRAQGSSIAIVAFLTNLDILPRVKTRRMPTKHDKDFYIDEIKIHSGSKRSSNMIFAAHFI